MPRSLIKPARCRVTAEIHFSTSKLVSRLLAPDDDARTQTDTSEVMSTGLRLQDNQACRHTLLTRNQGHGVSMFILTC